MPKLSDYTPGMKGYNSDLTLDITADLGDLLDANGNEILEFDAVASAVPFVRIANAATGNNPEISGQGETNVSLTLSGAGTGGILIDQDSNGVALTIDAESTTVNVLDVTAPVTTTGKVITVNSADALTTGIGLEVESAATAITGAGRLLRVDHTGTTSTTGVMAEFATAATDETVLARFTASDALAAGVVVDVSADAMTTGTGLDMGAMDALTTGKGVNIASTGEAITSGVLLDVDHTGSGDTLALFTGNVARFASSLDETRATGTTASDYDTVLISRTSINTTAGGTHTMAGAALKIETTSTETAGTLTDASYALEITHNARHDSADIYGISITADNPGTNAAGGIDLSSFAAGEPTINFVDGTASSIDPSATAETGWINIAVGGTIRYVPYYAAA